MHIFRRFMLNGAVMSLTSILLRGIGVAFNAFICGKLGEDGMGLFTLIMSVYGLAVTVAASGVNLASTRMCAEAIGRGNGREVGMAVRRCLTYALTCGCGACLLLYFGADTVAQKWLSDIRCAPSLRLLAVSLPFISASNVFHGYFAAVRRVTKSAACQVFEQLFRVFVICIALLYVVPDGIGYACIAIVGGGALAETVSFVMALVMYIADRKRHVCASRGAVDGRRLTRTLFGITVPIAAAACVRSGLSTLEHILIPRGLRKNPITADRALADYGTLCGMAFPVIMFPTALLYSFTGLLVPEFAEARTAGNDQRIRSMTTRSLRLTLIFSSWCSAVMALFSDELGMLIYQSADAGKYIFIMAPLIPIMYLDHAVDAILKGLDEQFYCMKVNIADAALCTFFVWLLCPRIGIYGYVLTVYAAEIMNASLSLRKLFAVTGFKADALKSFLIPVVCAGASAAVVNAVRGRVGLGGWPGLIAGILFGTAVFAAFLHIARMTDSRAGTRGGMTHRRKTFVFMIKRPHTH